MPILENQRHELFAQELAKGKSATEAYVSSGYQPSRKNAARLRTNEGVRARLAELQAATARSTEISIESICAELDQANQIAMQNGQAAAMVSASTLRAKLAGLLVQKIEQKVEVSDAFDRADSWEDLAAHMLEDFKAGPINEQDQQRMLDIVRRFSDDIDELKAEIIDRHEVVTLADNPIELKHRRQVRERRRLHGLKRHGHGNRRLLTNGGGA